MLTLEVHSYKNEKLTVLSLIGEGTKIITQVYSDQIKHVADYITYYKPDRVKFNNTEFENKVLALLHR